MKKDRREQWIDEVLESAQGMSRAQAPAELYDKVLTGLQDSRSTPIVRLPIRQWAAAAVLLLAVNIASVVCFLKHANAPKAPMTELAGQMTLETTYSY